MSRHQKRRKPQGRAAAFGKARFGAKPVVDHTLRTLLVNYLALPPGSLIPTEGGRLYVSEDALLFLRAMMEREAQLPPGSLAATLQSIQPARRCA